MYTTCLFCNIGLGQNETIEALPIGRRLAFDGKKGRLWVVCHKCERWNLTPFEERWEALEQCERAFSSTRVRVSTDNIGLARMHEGLELVRVGPALRPEFAAWRYGDQFGRRRRRQLALTAGGLVLFGVVLAGGAAAGVAIGGFGYFINEGVHRIVAGRPEEVVARLRLNGEMVKVYRMNLARIAIVGSSIAPFAVEIHRKKNDMLLFDGPDAMRAAAVLLPATNRFGASGQEIREAVSRIEGAGDPSGYLAGIAGRAGATRDFVRSWWSCRKNPGLFALPKIDRLAIEMALQEESERRAMEGELAELEFAWRRAEEIASIADDLLPRPSIAAAFETLKRRAHERPVSPL